MFSLYSHGILGVVCTEPRGLTEAHSIRANFFPTAAVPGRSAALDVCVAPSNSAAAREDAAQAAFQRQHPITEGKFQTCGPKATCIAPRLDSGRTATACGHTNFAVCSRHRIQPQRTTNVG